MLEVQPPFAERPESSTFSYLPLRYKSLRTKSEVSALKASTAGPRRRSDVCIEIPPACFRFTHLQLISEFQRFSLLRTSTLTDCITLRLDIFVYVSATHKRGVATRFWKNMWCFRLEHAGKVSNVQSSIFSFLLISGLFKLVFLYW